MRALLVAGGCCDINFLKQYFEKNDYGMIIGIDAGAAYLYEAGIVPDYLVGDFDSLSMDILNDYSQRGIKIDRYSSEKDETDTEIAIIKAVDAKCDEIHILAATGNRVDHLLGTIQSTMISYEKNIKTYIIDKNNRIHIAFKREEINKSEQYGKYVSYIPMTAEVTGVTLKGYKYPLDGAILTNNRSLAVSNQIVDNKAVLSYEDGVLLMVESKD